MHSNAKVIRVERHFGDGASTIHLKIDGSYSWCEGYISTSQARDLHQQLTEFLGEEEDTDD